MTISSVIQDHGDAIVAGKANADETMPNLAASTFTLQANELRASRSTCATSALAKASDARLPLWEL